MLFVANIRAMRTYYMHNNHTHTHTQTHERQQHNIRSTTLNLTSWRVFFANYNKSLTNSQIRWLCYRVRVSSRNNIFFSRWLVFLTRDAAITIVVVADVVVVVSAAFFKLLFVYTARLCCQVDDCVTFSFAIAVFLFANEQIHSPQHWI